MSLSKFIDCVFCSQSVRCRIFVNHLVNQHKVTEEQINSITRMHLDKKFKNVLKRKRGIHKNKTERCHKKPMGRTGLKKRFEDAIREQNLNMVVFVKLLRDVSIVFHKSKMNRKNEGIQAEDIEKVFHDASLLNESMVDYKGDLKFKINAKEDTVEKLEDVNNLEKVENDNSIKILEESLLEEDSLIGTNTLNFYQFYNSLAKNCEAGRLKSPGSATKMKTSTPKQKKLVESFLHKKEDKEDPLMKRIQMERKTELKMTTKAEAGKVRTVAKTAITKAIKKVTPLLALRGKKARLQSERVKELVSRLERDRETFNKAHEKVSELNDEGLKAVKYKDEVETKIQEFYNEYQKFISYLQN